MMMIDEVFLHVVGDRGALKDQLFQRAREQGLSVAQATEPFAVLPASVFNPVHRHRRHGSDQQGREEVSGVVPELDQGCGYRHLR